MIAAQVGHRLNVHAAAAENAGTVTVRLVDCPSSVIVIPQHEWPCFQLDGKPDESSRSFRLRMISASWWVAEITSRFGSRTDDEIRGVILGASGLAATS